MAHRIATFGPIGNGKTTVAKYLAGAWGYRVASFGHALKLSVARTVEPLGVPAAHFFGTQAEKEQPIAALGGVTGRRLLELVGTNGWRAADPDVWVRLAVATIEPNESVVFDDLRFPNEARILREAGALLVRVLAPGAPDRSTGHESDRAWREIEPDWCIEVPHGDLVRLRAEASLLPGMTAPAR